MDVSNSLSVRLILLKMSNLRLKVTAQISILACGIVPCPHLSSVVSFEQFEEEVKAWHVSFFLLHSQKFVAML